jgi:hypothetical protein
MSYEATVISILGFFAFVGLSAIIWDYFGKKAEKKAKKQV